MESRIYYICNRKKCKECHYPTCKHTEDIQYAMNYEYFNGNYCERQNSVALEHIEQLMLIQKGNFKKINKILKEFEKRQRGREQ